MTWPAELATIEDIPRQRPENPMLDQAPYMSPDAAQALCRLVGRHVDLLEIITDGNVDAEEIVGSMLIAAALDGSQFPETDGGTVAAGVLAGFGGLVGRVTAPDQLPLARLSFLLKGAALSGAAQDGAASRPVESADNDTL